MYFGFVLIVFYVPLSFAALSFNPIEWTHWERFILGLVGWITIGASILANKKVDKIFKVQ